MIAPSIEAAHSPNSLLRHCFSTEGTTGAVANVIEPIPQATVAGPTAVLSVSTSANPFWSCRKSEFFVRSVAAAQSWCGVTDTLYFALLALTNAPSTPASQMARLLIALADTIALVSRGQCLTPHGAGEEGSGRAQPSLPLDMLLHAEHGSEVYSAYVLETLDLLCFFIQVRNPIHVGLVEEAKQCVLHHVERKLQPAML
ncbi:hypothetical protein STCU_12201 [Strigomonas culicis]|uniref:Uncharacterized protein n=1 Tax=Strigomonas culicis TaxID=28005 RepID=S9TFY0_9TRYP|nr:hypothetical protein STCU_12201 [Strigomonas culicis]|eukprot:EPY15248.1 hypothetical protein STCU_12201 [Strigomonas culicis]